MSLAIDILMAAQQRAFRDRPKIGGFPYLAEVLRSAGVSRNIWHLPSCQSVYLTTKGDVITQGQALVNGTIDVPKFDREALIRALRTDQGGESTFPEFLMAAWKAGVIRYEVDFNERKVTYCGCRGEQYAEDYPAVQIAGT